ncbi:MAG: hypothetical protein EON56_00470 [Alphaproteobacteria bacterium]|nr:MAG: hypothetical protein EON56_00470 [Alphaproteobacteria bacterium]
MTRDADSISISHIATITAQIPKLPTTLVNKLLAVATASIFATAALAASPEIFEKDYKQFKDQMYYRVEFGSKARAPTKVEIEGMCRSLDKGESKFVVFVHYVGQRNSAYASCGRLKDQPRNTMDVKIF